MGALGNSVGLAILAGILGIGCSSDPAPVAVTQEDNGRTLDLAMDQEVDVTLQTIGPGQYGTPTLSSSAVDFEGMHFSSKQSPGGPTQIYQFRAVHSGNTLIVIPHDGEASDFALTLGCCAQ
jgi:hypothetical protein